MTSTWRLGYPIGSGVVEGACRHLVKDRMDADRDCAGLPSGAQAMLDLRATYLNGEWNAFWELPRGRRKTSGSTANCGT